MKKYFLLIILSTFSQLLFSQAYISGTLKQGSQANSVYVVIKSNTALSGVNFSTFQFELGVPTSVIGSKPEFKITSLDPNLSYAFDGAIETQDGKEYYGFGFSGDGSLNGAGTEFKAGEEHIMAEVFFNGPSSNPTFNPLIASQVRMMQLPDGGSTRNVNFYLADKGTDVTNTNAQFYGGSEFNNDGKGYEGSSYVALTGITLPVKLSSFTVSAKDNEALLSWAVENQDANSGHFEIERSSNGIDFTQVGTVNTTANSKDSYSYSDRLNNLSGVVYYRLKMVDKDGQFAYSDIKSVQLGNITFAASLYPNPVQNLTKLNITLDKAEVIKISVNNALGNLVQQFEIKGQKGMNEKSIDLSSVPSGSYMIRVQAGQNGKTLSVIKN